MKRFEELRVWQNARTLVKEIYNLNAHCKDFGFRDQIQRAVVSIMNNIAEGSESGTDAMFVRYLYIAKGSCGEVKSMIYLGNDLGYYPNEVIAQLISDTVNISSSLQKLIEYLKQSNSKAKQCI
jgi:four helix bundle protein